MPDKRKDVGVVMTVALITEADANPGESAYIAAELSGAGVTTRQSPGPRIPADGTGDVRILVPFVATPVTAEVMNRCRRARQRR